MIKGKGANISKSTVYNAVQTIKRELELAIERYETQPGQQAQVDWAYLPGMRVNENGHEVPVYAFLFILGYSRSVYVEFVTSMKTKTMISCLQHAFESVGGVPKEVLFDNCAQVVNLCINPDNKYKKDRAIIPEFQSFADYTGFKIVLCDPYTPQQKGKCLATNCLMISDFAGKNIYDEDLTSNIYNFIHERETLHENYVFRPVNKNKKLNTNYKVYATIILSYVDPAEWFDKLNGPERVMLIRNIIEGKGTTIKVQKQEKTEETAASSETEKAAAESKQ